MVLLVSEMEMAELEIDKNLVAALIDHISNKIKKLVHYLIDLFNSKKS